ncbi:TonB-dependent receptor domain-containing protein [Pseudoduganella plicata]|uniref:Outer membrane protein n=1 Tax=Pseudoduganella plicata TaxID=321984 RepID=A0A4P7BEA2_9BURK|nr:TonB-dependent receptor [Pseudoduganella plicata]QBQ37031.1 TonB-dependent receptor [Pseudoduganella plicata]GGY99916.1 outer membrane protein [Pseudoduganella plicata]
MHRSLSNRTPLALALALAFGTPIASAQADKSRTAADPDSVPAVVISASALGLLSDDMITPAASLSGNELVRQRESTLGETLNRQPGISSSQFGAGASRPIIRGMDGPRVRILSDGAEVQDASTISPDHAVAFEPMLAERIEVLRGPSALAYGGGAVGGVVNIIDRKIPTSVPVNPVEGAVEVRGNTAARERSAAFEMTGGSGNVAVHAEGVKRDANAYKTGSGWDEGGRVPGSFKDGETGSVGLSWVGERGYIGAAYTKERTDYGIPGHAHEFASCHPHGSHLHCGGHGDEDEHGHEGEHGHEHGAEVVPAVKLDSDRWDVRGEYRDPLAGFSKLRVRAAFTDYRHDELEGDEVATSFRNKAHDVRAELEHLPVAGWRGVIGVQTTRRDFSAQGEEAYVPPTLTKKHAVFVTEEYRLADWRFEAAARHEWQDIDVDASAGSADHSERGTSLALGAVWKFAPQYSLGASFSRSHRLPTAEELYAHGVHLATSTYEIGNENLRKETSNNLDITLRKFAGPTTFSVSAYRNRINDYIYASTLDNHEGFQLVEYAQRDATFTGIEGEVRHQIAPSVQAALFGDYVRAELRDGTGNRNLPRIPSGRVGVKLDAEWRGWHGVVEAYRVAKQDDVAEFETATAGYNMLNLGTHYTTRVLGLPAMFYARLNNATNELAFSHTSFIKHAAPLPGRNLTAGLRLSF